jgi:FSR family fosmidomycin resistance protein-like MFS transporter
MLVYIARWYSVQVKEEIRIKKENKKSAKPKRQKQAKNMEQNSRKRKVIFFTLSLLIFLVFARSWFQAGITNFYAFYLIEQYGITIRQAQVYLFIFLAAGAAGTFAGGPLSDRFGKRGMITVSLLGAAPLTLILPHTGPLLSYLLLGIIGFIVLSSFSVTVVYAQELVPGKIGTMSGLIVGLAFGLGAVGSVALGWAADIFGLTNTILFAASLPLIGLLSFLLPSDQQLREMNQ